MLLRVRLVASQSVQILAAQASGQLCFHYTVRAASGNGPCLTRAKAFKCAAAEGHETLAGEVTHLVEVKKSKFVARAWQADTPSQASILIEEHRDPNASHNCWAYRCGLNCMRSADDGEPSGTAGRPILGAIEGEGMDHVAVLVTRYFGGVKLGAGGLVRAYGRAARECLRQGQRKRVDPVAVLIVEVPLQHIGSVYALLDQHGAQRMQETYLDDGSLQMQIAIEEAQKHELHSCLMNATSGTVTLSGACEG